MNARVSDTAIGKITVFCELIDAEEPFEPRDNPCLWLGADVFEEDKERYPEFDLFDIICAGFLPSDDGIIDKNAVISWNRLCERVDKFIGTCRQE